QKLVLSNCRLLYGSERFKFYDVAICENETDGSFAAMLTCNQSSTTKVLRIQVGDCPLKATRLLSDRIIKDTGKLFTKFTVGSQLQGQQGHTNQETGVFELTKDTRDARTPRPDDDTEGLSRNGSDAPPGAPSGPRGYGRGGYEGGVHKRRAPEQMSRVTPMLDYGDEM
ncbi:hypothetical protein BDW02DRAFT_511342, partial [Decorospora gaudefroyi]